MRNYDDYDDDDYGYDGDNYNRIIISDPVIGDDIGKGNSGNTPITTQPVNDIRITDKNADKAINKVMDAYLQATKHGDTEALISIIAEVQRNEVSRMDGTALKNRMISTYGSDFEITYKVTDKKKMDQTWMDNLNTHIKEEGYNEYASECYAPLGSITISGSLKTETTELKENSETWICKIGKQWYLVGG